jgi:hypothetical protein
MPVPTASSLRLLRGGLTGALALLAVCVPAARPAPAPPRAELLRAVLEEVAVPPLHGAAGAAVAPGGLPAFTPRGEARYGKGKEPAAKFRAAVRKAQVALWVVSPAAPPAGLAADVRATRRAWKVDVSSLKTAYRAPLPGPPEDAFREALLRDNKGLARMVWHLTEALDELKEVGQARGEQPPRWQANYDFVLANLQAQVVVLDQRQWALGQMRKELPPRDPALHAGWCLVPSPRVQGDNTTRRLALDSGRLFERIVREHPNTAWAELARRARLVKFGVDWQAVP